jgi:hypothetical protein
VTHRPGAWKLRFGALRAASKPFDVPQRWRQKASAAVEALLRDDLGHKGMPQAQTRTDKAWGAWAAISVAQCWSAARYCAYPGRSA